MWCQIQKCCWAHPLPVIKLLATQRGHREEKGDCFPHWPPVLNNWVQLVPLNHQLSLGPSTQLIGPDLASIFTLCSMPCLPLTVSGVLAPRVLGDRSACHKPLLYNQVTCPSPVECLGKLSHISFGCIKEKQESLVDLFLSPFFNAIQVWSFLWTGKCLSFKSQPDTDSQLNLRTAVTLCWDLKFWTFYNFYIVSLFFPLHFYSLHQESRKSFQLVVKDDWNKITKALAANC